MNNKIFDETISLEIDNYYELDLKEDFMMNDTLDLYEFINYDVKKSFYLAANIDEWFNKLDPEKQYLYSKQIRRNNESISRYKNQIDFWTGKYSKIIGSDDLPIVKTTEYILNNMIYDDESDPLDPVKLAFMFGNFLGKERKDEVQSNN